MSEFSIVTYGEHALQQISVFTDADGPNPPSSKWVIYIHGGAWRDPNNNHQDGHHLLKSLRATDPTLNGASIDYRLSPEITHPGHIEDVVRALLFLIQKYDIQEYTLVGHSAGAFLAMQSLIFPNKAGGEALLPQPKTIVGVEGIYDLRLTVEEEAGYDSFVSGAFGSIKEEWDVASPASGRYQFVNKATVGNKIKEGVKEVVFKGKIVCVHSSEDELLSLNYQPKNLERIVNLTDLSQRVPFEKYIVSGKHDEVFGRMELVHIVSKFI